MIRFDERKCTIISEGQIFDTCISVTRVSAPKKWYQITYSFSVLKKNLELKHNSLGYDKRQKFGLKFTTISNFMLNW
jgi:hypothetical protein